MNDVTLFIIQLSATGLEVDEFAGVTFAGHAAICRDDEELVRGIRATTMDIGIEPLPRGGYLIYPKTQAIRNQGGRATVETEATDGTAVVVVHGESARPTGS